MEFIGELRLRCKDGSARDKLARLLDADARAEFADEVAEEDLAWWHATELVELPGRIEFVDAVTLKLCYDAPVADTADMLDNARSLSLVCGESWLLTTGDEDGYELAKFVAGERKRSRTR